MITNSSNAKGAVEVFTDVVEEQQAYDALDPKLRQLVQSAPEKLSCAWLLAMQHKYGVDYMLSSYSTMLRQRYPDWTPL